MKRFIAALVLGAALLTASAHGAVITLNGKPLDVGDAPVYDGTTYVSLRVLTGAIDPEAQVSWITDRAVVSGSRGTLIAQPGEDSLWVNGKSQPLSGPVRLENSRTLVPIRSLAAFLGAQVDWEPLTGVISLTTAGGQSGQAGYSAEDLYWLSRIISAESQGESWEGKIAVGNVVLNRVASPQFPDTVYDVIFDPRWGGQFEPVRNGTIYLSPTPESVQAALACFNGENTARDSLYFLAPQLTSNHWTMDNRTYITTIGVHWFYR